MYSIANLCTFIMKMLNTVSIFKVEGYTKQGTNMKQVCFCFAYSSNLKVKVIYFCKMLTFVPQDRTSIHCCKKLKSYKRWCVMQYTKCDITCTALCMLPITVEFQQMSLNLIQMRFTTEDT